MLAHNFLSYMQTASLAARVAAVSEFAQYYKEGLFEGPEAEAAESVLTLLLDDPHIAVRRAMAQKLADAERMQAPLVTGLIHDRPLVAAIMARHSPLLDEEALIRMARFEGPAIQIAIADRPALGTRAQQAVAAYGGLEACLALLDNQGTRLSPAALETLMHRHGRDADIREALLRRHDLPVTVQHDLIVGACLAGREDADADSLADAADSATAAFAAGLSGSAPGTLALHLAETGRLTPAFLLRIVLNGQIAFFETVMASLTAYGPESVSGLMQDCRGSGFCALYQVAALPSACFPVFDAAIAVWRLAPAAERQATAALRRRMLDSAIVAAAEQAALDGGAMLRFLTRYDAEASQEAMDPAAPPVQPAETDPLVEAIRASIDRIQSAITDLLEPDVSDEEHSSEALEPLWQSKAAPPRRRMDEDLPPLPERMPPWRDNRMAPQPERARAAGA